MFCQLNKQIAKNNDTDNYLNNRINKLLGVKQTRNFEINNDPYNFVKNQKTSPKLTPPLPVNSEMHIPGYNFCGPGTQVEARLKRGDRGVNALDNACRIHDVEYMLFNDDPVALMESDRKLKLIASKVDAAIEDKLRAQEGVMSKFLRFVGLKVPVNNILNPTDTYNQYSAKLVEGVFTGKGFLDELGITDPVSFAQGLNKEGTTPKEEQEKGGKLYEDYIMQ